MNLKQLKYQITETIKHKGVMWFVWRILAFIVLCWLFWPEPKVDAPIDDKKDVGEHEQQGSVEKAWHELPETDRDLRKILTTTQSAFYWDSFNWMMEYGKPMQPKDFESKIINFFFVFGKPFTTKKKVKCQMFREKIVLLGKANNRSGLACKRSLADWCKQIEGEKMQCRDKKPSGFDALTEDMFDSHNFKIKLQRNLYNIPGF